MRHCTRPSKGSKNSIHDRHGPWSKSKRLGVALLISLSPLFWSSCSKEEGGPPPEPEPPETPLVSTDENCLLESSWQPGVTGVTESNRDPNVEIFTEEITRTGPLTGLADGLTGGRDITFTFNIPDLGPAGSITLDAQAGNFPEALDGSAFPVLVSLSDGVNEWVNLKRSGSGGDCAANGLFTCDTDTGQCTINSACTILSPSAYVNRNHWEQNYLAGFGYATTYRFPNCQHNFGCFFTDEVFDNGKLPAGTYTAKYALISGNYASVTGYDADVNLTVIKKRDNQALAFADNGAFDLNLIFVGQENRAALEDPQGRANINTLVKGIHDHYNQSNSGVKLGKVRAFEWYCNSGEEKKNINLDDVGSLIQDSSQDLNQMAAGTEGRAVNVVVVNSIVLSGNNNSSTILGIAGALDGPYKNERPSSGVAVATFSNLISSNPNCTTSPCASTTLDDFFFELISTFSHEIGHYFGLNHLTERQGSVHDPLPDTPTCNTEMIGRERQVTHSSCLQTCSSSCASYTGILNFCPAVSECGFNHVMYWTVKNYNENSGAGDGNLFSAQSGHMINYHSFTR